MKMIFWKKGGEAQFTTFLKGLNNDVALTVQVSIDVALSDFHLYAAVVGLTLDFAYKSAFPSALLNANTTLDLQADKTRRIVRFCVLAELRA